MPYICRRMNPGFEVIYFDWLGLRLQEPMALITNWLMALFSFYAYGHLNKGESAFQTAWKSFYLMLGISTTFGGLGHLFFQYSSFYGKFPSWIFGILAGVYASFGMISTIENEKRRNLLRKLVVIKSSVLLLTALLTVKFLFVAIDTTLTYILFCGFLAYRLHKKDWEGVQYFYLGVLALLPSAFIFGLKVNLSLWLNKDDLSHLFMLACLIFFYFGVRSTQKLMEHKLS